MALAVLALGGCTRTFYRTQADQQVYTLVEQKACNPDWPMPDFSVYPNPRARFYDPYDPDHEPMPPDDPNSHAYMKRVDGKNGYPWWHANGDTPFVENPDWMSYLPLNQDGVLVLDADGAVEMARLQSRNYQTQLEELYLSALDVTFERFRFDAQFFAGWQAFYTADGPERGGAGNSRSVLSTGTFPATQGFRVNRLTSTGGEYVVGLANAMVWQFSGPDTQSANTLLDFALVQPLLRGGGRDRVLERLTLSERTLLANVRAMQRYRQEFYTDTMTGRNAGAGPQRRGGVFGAGLEGFSGVGGSGFGTVATGSQITAGIAGVTGGAGAGQAGGYLGLLQRQQNIRNQEANIAALRSSLAQLEAFYDAGRIDFFQVELARQALYNAQSQLLNNRTGYLSSLDQYKQAIGLPPTLDVRIEDNILERFNIIDEAVIPLQNDVSQLQIDLGRQLAAIETQVQGEGDMATIAWSPELERQLKAIRAFVVTAERIRRQLMVENLARAKADIAELERAMPGRLADIERLSARIKEAQERAAQGNDYGPATIDPEIFNVPRLKGMPQQLRSVLAEVVTRASGYEQIHQGFVENLDGLLANGAQLEPRKLLEELNQKLLLEIPGHLTDLSATVLELTLVQARARTESVSLPEVEISSTRAIEVARENRLDWMNARASLVDSWRLIEFTADNLESDLDVIFSGDISNTGNNPLNLNGNTGRLRAGLQFDSPLTRLSERNTYRQSLIEYQQARRSYYNFEDTIKRVLRDEIRVIELNQINFELRRAAVHVAVGQVELTRLRLQEPPKPGVEQVFNNTTARDLVSALSDLLNVQNDFLSVWVNYEVQRRNLDLDLGTMQLDQRGIWIDPGKIDENYGVVKQADDAQLEPGLLYEDLPPGEDVDPALSPPEPLPEPLPEN
jgi:hypothetical protein